jgi:TRAP-type uncharacterized transport system substrate-binding protein
MPEVTRSKIMLEVASELCDHFGKPWRQAFVYLRRQGPEPWSARLWGSDTPSGIDAVAGGEADFAIINPAGILTLAYRGTGPYHQPLPLRVVTVIPSYDQFCFAVKPELGLNDFEEIGERKVPLRVSLRGQADHSVHFMLDHIMEAAGFSMQEFKRWGGQPVYTPGMPNNDRRMGAAARGEVDAVFDEAVGLAASSALAIGMKILPLREATVRKLEALGYRRGIIEKATFPQLPADVLSIDFSGWPVFCHENTDDELVTHFCEGLEARKHAIPYQGPPPLPLERMCRDTPEGPLDVPLHPAAERFWRAKGYLQ